MREVKSPAVRLPIGHSVHIGFSLDQRPLSNPLPAG